MNRLLLKTEPIFDLELIEKKLNILKLKELDPIDFYLDFDNVKINQYIIYGLMRKKNSKKYYLFQLNIKEDIEDIIVETIECSYCSLKEFNKIYKFCQCNMCYIGNSVKNNIKNTVYSFLNPEIVVNLQKRYKYKRLLLILMIHYYDHVLNNFEKEHIIKLLDYNTKQEYENWIQLNEIQKQTLFYQNRQFIQNAEKNKNIYDPNRSFQCIPFSENNYIKRCNNNKKPNINFSQEFKEMVLNVSAIEIAKNLNFLIETAQEYIDLT